MSYRSRIVQLQGLTLIVLVACTLAACGSSSGASKQGAGGSSGTASSDAGESGKTLSISIDTNAPSINTVDAYWAKEQHIWKKLGLNVTYSASGSNTGLQVTSGRVAAAIFSTSAVVSPITAGKQMSIIGCEETRLASGGVYAQASSKARTLADMSGATVGTMGPGSGTYAAALILSNYIVSQGGKPLHIEIYTTSSAISAALGSGRLEASVGSVSIFAPLINSGKVREIVDPGGTLANSLFPPTMCTYGWYGLTSKLQANREAVTRLIAGIRIAHAQATTASVAGFASVLSKLPDFAPNVLSTANLQAEVKQTTPFLTKDESLPESYWPETLKYLQAGGVSSNNQTFNVNTPPFAYDKVVDMSYWNAATAIIQSSGISTTGPQ